tara:strand:- start:121 stop:513 length:393 start_codon:yes stop_codon:yes gene_type:complete
MAKNKKLLKEFITSAVGGIVTLKPVGIAMNSTHQTQVNEKKTGGSIKLYDLLPEDEQDKVNKIMDDMDINDPLVKEKFLPKIKEFAESYKRIAEIGSVLKHTDSKLSTKLEKVSEVLEDIAGHLEAYVKK